MEFGRDYDFNQSFFKQFRKLEEDVPQLALLQENSVNSPWINYELDDKNCYLNFGGHYNEDSAYNQYALKSKNCFDNYWLMHGEFCFESTLIENAYRVLFSKYCYDCQETYFSFDCKSCSNIFGCTGLRHKQYHISNKPVSKEEFTDFIKQNNLGSYKNIQKLKQETEEFIKSQPQRAVFIEKSVNSTGNNIYESKNCQFCWSTEKTENSKYCLFALDLKDSIDITSVWGAELSYEFIAGAEQLSGIKFTFGSLKGSSNQEYCHLCFGSSNCFGSTNLRSKKYCILNKQYTEDDYEKMVEKIKKHMDDMPFIDKRGLEYKYGEFFPGEISHFGYNESVANEYFPLKKEEVVKTSFYWSDEESESKYEFSNYEIPDDIKEVKDDILEKVLKCEESGKAYKIIPMELQFYRRFNLPIPRLAPFERHRQRMNFIANHLKLISRKCFSCNQETVSVYTENEFPKVYCEKCYLKNIY